MDRFPARSNLRAKSGLPGRPRECATLDLTKDLMGIDIPVLIAHGDDDQIVPIGAASLKSDMAGGTAPQPSLGPCAASTGSRWAAIALAGPMAQA
jgi:pimeloyl-ACP methyl ester carboxylesterase